jgi:hypothetical protein
MRLRLLKQDNGTFVFRELLKAVNILHPGFSMVSCSKTLISPSDITHFKDLARKLASQATEKKPKRDRDARFYAVSRAGAAASTSAAK